MKCKKCVYVCFIDHSKAFDKVKHEKMMQILSELDIDGEYLRTVRNLQWEQSTAIRTESETSCYKAIKQEVRQGYMKSPDIFNIYSEMILRDVDNLDVLMLMEDR